MSNSINTEGTSSRLTRMSSSAQTGAGSAAHSFKSGAHSAQSAFTGGVKKGFTGGAKGTLKLNGKLADGIRAAGRKQLTADSTTHDAAGMYDAVTKTIAHPIQTAKKSAHAVKTVGKAGVNTAKATVKGTVKVAKAVRHPVKTAKQIGTNLRKAGQAVKNAPRNAVKSVKQSLTRAKNALRKAKHNVKAAAKALRHPVKTARAIGNAIKKAAQAAMKAIIHGLLHLLGMLAGAFVGVIAVVGIVLVIMIMLNSIFGSWGEEDKCFESPGNLSDTYYYRIGGGHPYAYIDAASPMGYWYGNCTDYTAWRLIQDEGGTKPYNVHARFTPKGGNGKQWGDDGNLPGWDKVAVAEKIQHGDVISMHDAFEADATYGHVAYIATVNVNKGKLTWQSYSYNKYEVRTVNLSDVQKGLDNGTVVVKHNPHRKDVSGSASACAITGDAKDAKEYAKKQLAKHDDWDQDKEFACLDKLWTRESNWRWNADNPSSHAYGIPQSLPGDKMASEGDDWRTNYKTQIRWGLNYIKGRYQTPCGAWDHSQATGWY